jgi:hypothetical protein
MQGSHLYIHPSLVWNHFQWNENTKSWQQCWIISIIYCFADIDECSSNPCLNGGTCTDQVNGYSCTCVAGYTGNRCENSELLAFMSSFMILSLLKYYRIKVSWGKNKLAIVTFIYTSIVSLHSFPMNWNYKIMAAMLNNVDYLLTFRYRRVF